MICIIIENVNINSNKTYIHSLHVPLKKLQIHKHTCVVFFCEKILQVIFRSDVIAGAIIWLNK
jgi:hypothetical protein